MTTAPLREKHLLFLSDVEERDDVLIRHGRLQGVKEEYLLCQEKLRPLVEKALAYLFAQEGAWELDEDSKGVQFLFYPYGLNGSEDKFDPLIAAMAEWTDGKEVYVRITEAETVWVTIRGRDSDSSYPPFITVRFRGAVLASEYLFHVPGAKGALRQAVQRELDDKEEEMRSIQESAKRYVEWLKKLE